MKTLILSIARVALLAMAVFSVLAKEAGNPTEAGTAFAPTIPNKTAPV